MAAISASSGPTSFNHTGDPQDEYADWNHASHSQHEPSTNHSFPDYEAFGSPQNASNSQNGATDSFFNLRDSRSNSRAVAQPKTKRANDGSILTYDDENSKWIHRDKLAKIESRELQEAGIVLPKPRTQSRSRRDRSHSRRRGTTDSSEQQYVPVSRMNSDAGHDKTPDHEVSSWDLRRPEEIAEDPGEYWVSNDSGRGTRIPVAKVSPAPIPSDYIDRNAPVQRKTSFPPFDDEVSIAYPKTRSRSNSSANALDDSPKAPSGKRSLTEGSPRKTTTTTPRKTSAPTKPTTQGRPKTRSGPTTRSSSTTRPATRSGELSPRAPEGDPPWMISAYQPDPRLPPDQQLLPTVAKRLQQEKWEQEGSFGNIYDKEFRPLNKDTLIKPPEAEKHPDSEDQDEWPLKPEARVPTPNRPGTSSYSTMPKIQDTPAMNPLGSPRSMQQVQTQTTAAVKVVDPPAQTEDENGKDGCGCCVVM
ncbi:hypothetical protein F5B22DRAFT_352704 [Xylaria bambusicola]|uniref:uncharacterized protein n=1 Tax=Xylaria bambusicola TaxID=326684 RepID=UPI0020072407|nr:uncharacterized protein F5B22DRAFT_352704 [Xylaria bambusicola]KAI0525628.1 hypothetical protein F5B22DRAFT_352704 [Xylaria bambusicola]